MNVKIKFFRVENSIEKAQYAAEVYDFLEVAYKNCGGISLANGFADAQDMLSSIPVWRLTFIDEKLISVIMFKERLNKMKMVAYAPLAEIDKEVRTSDLQFILNNSYAELSGKLLSIVLKEIKTDIKNYLSKTPETILKKRIIPLMDYLETRRLPSNSEGMYKKLSIDYPELLEYCYLRRIGNEFKLKLLIELNS